MHPTGCVRTTVAFIVLLFSASFVSAANPPGSKLDPKADQTLRDLGKYLGGLDSLQFQADTVYRIKGNGQIQDFKSSYRFTLQRPARMAIVPRDASEQGSVVCDGQQAWQYIPAFRQYIVRSAPKNTDELLNDATLVLASSGPAGPAMFVPMLLDRDPYKKLMEGVTDAKHLGEEEIDGARCHHVRCAQEGLDWDIWIETGAKPVVRKIVPDLSKALEGVDLKELKGVKIELVIVCKNWKANEPLPAEVFKFTVPEGAKKVDSFDPNGGEAKVHQLVGKPAPGFKTDRLEGGHFDLADVKGKVVIFDFWATWCGPCVQGLPIVSEVAKAFEKKGVLFYAVNCDEEPKAIQDFLEEKTLKIAVLLDRGGQVGQKYGVTGIPQTVILGKDGTVQVVHVGLLPNLKEELTIDLEALIKGENLAEKTLKAAAGAEAESPKN